MVATLALVLCAGDSRAQQDIDWVSYHRAVEFCRGTVPRPMALSSDRQVLCFDGAIVKEMDVTLARRLNEGGLFVARSLGGNAASAIVLSDLIRDRRATVVVYDYCLSTCAGFFLIASQQTFVVKGTLVAWSYPGSEEANCVSLRTPPDRGPRKWRPAPCEDEASEDSEERDAQNRFFRERVVKPFLEAPPDSLYVRRILRSRFSELGTFDDIAWTIHPRFYPSLFKTRIIFESYPESQQEVDDMVSRLRPGIRVIYDP